jgi:hypothetical protein
VSIARRLPIDFAKTHIKAKQEGGMPARHEN